MNKRSLRVNQWLFPAVAVERGSIQKHFTESELLRRDSLNCGPVSAKDPKRVLWRIDGPPNGEYGRVSGIWFKNLTARSLSSWLHSAMDREDVIKRLGQSHQVLKRGQSANKRKHSEMTMKTLLSAIVALSFVAAAVAPAAASDFSIKTLDQDSRGGHNYGGSVLEQLDKEGRGGHNT